MLCEPELGGGLFIAARPAYSSCRVTLHIHIYIEIGVRAHCGSEKIRDLLHLNSVEALWCMGSVVEGQLRLFK